MTLTSLADPVKNPPSADYRRHKQPARVRKRQYQKAANFYPTPILYPAPCLSWRAPFVDQIRRLTPFIARKKPGSPKTHPSATRPSLTARPVAFRPLLTESLALSSESVAPSSRFDLNESSFNPTIPHLITVSSPSRILAQLTMNLLFISNIERAESFPGSVSQGGD